jgi:hypothetical protein
LDEISRLGDPMVGRACDYLTTITKPDGGTPFVLPSVRAYARAPWWEPNEDPEASVVPTAGIVALLYKHKVNHPWLVTATKFCWRKIDELEAADLYEVRFVLEFLQHVPDRVRAEKNFTRIGPKIFEQNLVALDPAAPGEVFTPLDYAPRPDSLGRRLFSDEVIRAHLDTLAQAQGPDGGWSFNWTAWNPTTTLEWRGWVTIQALKTLRAYGRPA